MMITTIRPATEADADAIAEAHVDSIRTLGPATYASETVDVWGAARSGERYVRSHRLKNGPEMACVYMKKTLVE
jgi:hypothetical protein